MASISVDDSLTDQAGKTSEADLLQFDSQNEVPINLLPADKHPIWNEVPLGRNGIEDAPQLEYDEHDIHLIADREIDDDELEYDGVEFRTHLGFTQDQADSDFSDNHDETPNADLEPFELNGNGTSNPHRALIKGNISSDGIIDDDFESELAGHETNEIADSEDADYHLVSKIAEYGIVECCGDDKFGRKTIVCSACRLPKESDIKKTEFGTMANFFDCLLKYALRTFDQYVDMDYVIIYLHHGLHSYNRPAYGWLIRSYVKVARKYKKNLKAFYIVHPTKWIKFLWPLLRPLISAKFSRKVTYINRLDQLAEYVHLDNIQIPEEVKHFDPIVLKKSIPNQVRPTAKFCVSLQFILANEPGETVPLVLRQTVEFLKNFGLNEPGIFRRSAAVSVIKQVQEKYDDGRVVSFEQYGDIHLAACVLKTFLRNLTEPLLTFRLYPEICGLSGTLKQANRIEVIRDLITEKLPTENYNVLKYLIEFLNLVSNYAETNLMNTSNLSIVFAPNLAWSEDEQMNSVTNYNLIQTFTETLIARYTELFLK